MRATADYQVRKWRAWHHHMALMGLALLLLLEEKQSHHESLPLLSAAEITEMLDYYFCQPASAGAVVGTILNRHRRRTVSWNQSAGRRENEKSPPENP